MDTILHVQTATFTLRVSVTVTPSVTRGFGPGRQVRGFDIRGELRGSGRLKTLKKLDGLS